MCNVWYQQVVHPNSNKLLVMLNSGLIQANSHISSSDVNSSRAICRISKSKSLAFFAFTHVCSCFDLIHSDLGNCTNNLEI